MTIRDDGVVTMLGRCRAVVYSMSDDGVVTMLGKVTSYVTNYILVGTVSGGLTTESGITIITESGDALVTET